MSTLEELGILDDEALIEIPDDIPEESSGYVPLVQPGKYVLRLPSDLSAIWTAFDARDKGKRVSAGFIKDNPLTVEEDEQYGLFKKSPVTTFINNVEYPRGREGVLVSDMFYLIRALEANLPEDERSLLKTNKDYVTALQKYEGKLFKATIAWTAYCNPSKNIWMAVEDEEGNRRTEEQEGTPGCGRNYTSYARNPEERIPQGDDEFFLERFDEYDVHGDEQECPAVLRANIKLSRFEPFVG